MPFVFIDVRMFRKDLEAGAVWACSNIDGAYLQIVQQLQM